MNAVLRAQARAVVDGLPGDIVALALPLDIMKIAESGLIHADWQACRCHCLECWLSGCRNHTGCGSSSVPTGCTLAMPNPVTCRTT